MNKLKTFALVTFMALAGSAAAAEKEVDFQVRLYDVKVSSEAEAIEIANKLDLSLPISVEDDGDAGSFIAASVLSDGSILLGSDGSKLTQSIPTAVEKFYGELSSKDAQKATVTAGKNLGYVKSVAHNDVTVFDKVFEGADISLVPFVKEGVIDVGLTIATSDLETIREFKSSESSVVIQLPSMLERSVTQLVSLNDGETAALAYFNKMQDADEGVVKIVVLKATVAK